MRSLKAPVLLLFFFFVSFSLSSMTPSEIVSRMDEAVEARDEAAVGKVLAEAAANGDKKCHAYCCLAAGNYYYRAAEREKAKELYLEALRLYSEAGDLSGQGRAFSRIGGLHIVISEFDEAEKAFGEALKLARRTGDRKAEAAAYKGIGDVHNYRDEVQKAMENYERSLAAAVKAEDPSLQGDAYKSIGELYYFTDETDKAEANLSTAEELYRASGNESGLAGVYRRQGDLDFFAGDNDGALDKYGRALAIHEKQADPLGVAAVAKSVGDIHAYSGNFEEALKYYDKALPLMERTGNISGPGNIYYMKGFIFTSTGDNEKALEMFQRSLEYLQKAQSQLGQANAYFGMGEIFNNSADFAKAMEMYDKALPMYEAAGAAQNAGNVCLRKGNVHYHLEEHAQALGMYGKAEEIYRKSGDPRGLGTSLKCRGDVYHSLGDRTKAEEAYREAMPFFEKCGSLQGMANANLGLGAVYLDSGKYPESHRALDEAIAAYRKMGNLNDQAAALYLKARAFEAQGEKELAFVCFSSMTALLETARELTAFSDLKGSFMRAVYEDYEYAADFMAGNGRGNQAFTIAEALKSRVFLDSLAEQSVDLEDGISEEIAKKRDELLSRLSELSAAMNDSLEAGENEEAEKLGKDYYQAGRELEMLGIEIRLNNPMYASVRYPRPVSIEKLQGGVLEEDETLVEYFVSDKSVHAFVVTARTFETVKLPARPAKVMMEARAFTQFLRSGTFVPEAELAARGKRLYSALVAPVEHLLEKGTRLLIVPDGELALMPFEALNSSDGRKPVYLVERYPVSYFQSASVLALLREGGRPPRGTSFAGIGDPEYSALERLEGSREEVSRIASIFRRAGLEARTAVGRDATEEFAGSSAAGAAGYLHFACHGILEGGSQSLVLSDTSGGKEDGYFTMGEIMHCRFRARMAVLSACRTGEGRMEKGEGVTGLTRAFMYAGCPSAVVSLWSVDDSSTALLMSEFYDRMVARDKPPTLALRSAKLDLLRSGGHSHPFFWAPFVLYGE